MVFFILQQLCNYILCPKCYKAEVPGYVVVKLVCKGRCVRECFLCEVSWKALGQWELRSEYFKKGGLT